MANPQTQNQNLNSKSNIRYRSYHFSLNIIKFDLSLPEKRIYWSIGDQLLRSSTSIGANLVEAQSSSSIKDFMRYYEIALKSANETRYWLALLKDSDLVNNQEILYLIDEAKQIANMIGSSLLTMKHKKI
jgi:four helix bundle protein